MIQVEHRTGVAGVEDGGEVGPDGKGINKALAQLVVEDHPLVGGLHVLTGMTRVIGRHDN